MRDGIKLATDVYHPTNNTPSPVILGRTPYNKNSLFGVGMEAARRGYVFVAQDSRGRFASGGENLPFDLDMNDGKDTLEWISAQPWCNGKIGTWGASAGAINQFQSMITAHDLIDSQFLVVGAPNLYDVVYLDGIFRKNLIETWLQQNKFSSNALSIWEAHPTYDDYWKARDATRFYKQVQAPAVHIGGYWDIFGQKTIDAFNGYQKLAKDKSARKNQHLIIGPWTHMVLSDKAGDFTFRNGKNPPGDLEDAWKWFDATLKGIPNGIEKSPAVTYYVIGDLSDKTAPGNEWRTADSWPPYHMKATPMYLTADFKLSPSMPKSPQPLMYTYHPDAPAPTVGGVQLTLAAGPKDQSDMERRADVFSFTGEVLDYAVEMTGRVRADLWIASDSPDTDFFATVCDVYPDGRSINLCEGRIRTRFREGFDHEKFLSRGKPVPVEMDLWSTSVIFNKGHRIRVHITSSSSPGFDVNPNTGEGFRAGSDIQNAHNYIYVDAQHPSHLLLPLVRSH
jgi:putative CocE/NonD family hydrolase